jgi:hypothetical protein
MEIVNMLSDAETEMFKSFSPPEILKCYASMESSGLSLFPPADVQMNEGRFGRRK